MTNESYKTTIAKLSDLQSMVGQELGLTDWLTITQDDINKFAVLTGDEQWIHVDEEKAKVHSPYGKTIAHGYFVLSQAARFSFATYEIQDIALGLNYGVNKVRFINAVVVDSRIRGRVSLLDYVPLDQGARIFIKLTVEIEGQEKPACVAECIAQLHTNS